MTPTTKKAKKPKPEPPAALFDAGPLTIERRPVAELATIHREGVALLRAMHFEDDAILRVRDAADMTPTRLRQVTVRYRMPNHEPADEWLAIETGRAKQLVYGWLDRSLKEPAITHHHVLNAFALAEDVVHRPGCLVRSAQGLTHHAPGGAEFLVVDLRRVRSETVVYADPAAAAASDTAPVVEQGRLV